MKKEKNITLTQIVDKEIRHKRNLLEIRLKDMEDYIEKELWHIASIACKDLLCYITEIDILGTVKANLENEK